WIGKLNIKGIFKVAYFEAFYTTVCTIGLYYASRFLASDTFEHFISPVVNWVKEPFTDHRRKLARSATPLSVSEGPEKKVQEGLLVDFAGRKESFLAGSEPKSASAETEGDLLAFRRQENAARRVMRRERENPVRRPDRSRRSVGEPEKVAQEI